MLCQTKTINIFQHILHDRFPIHFCWEDSGISIFLSMFKTYGASGRVLWGTVPTANADQAVTQSHRTTRWPHDVGNPMPIIINNQSLIWGWISMVSFMVMVGVGFFFPSNLPHSKNVGARFFRHASETLALNFVATPSRRLESGFQNF